MFSWYGDTRRKFPRVRPTKGKPIRIDINGKNFIEIVGAKDIGIGGVGIMIPHGFKDCEIDKTVSIMVDLPAPCKVRFSAIGKIVHIAENFFGGNFINLEAKHKKILERYVRLRLSEESTGLKRWLLKLGL